MPQLGRGDDRKRYEIPRDVIKLIEADGWHWVTTRGSHRKYKHPTKPNFIIVPAHNLGSDVKIGIEKKILKDAGLL